MVAEDNSSTGHLSSLGATSRTENRNQTISMNGIAKFRSLRLWQPRIGDFIIYHGWLFGRWYGIISDVTREGRLSVIKDGLPFLLLTTLPDQQTDKSIEIPSSKIIQSRGGAYAVLQEGVWHIND